jgi:hypothetical protein
MVFSQWTEKALKWWQRKYYHSCTQLLNWYLQKACTTAVFLWLHSTFCGHFILKTILLAQQLLLLLVGTACCTLFTVHFCSKQLHHESIQFLLSSHVTKKASPYSHKCHHMRDWNTPKGEWYPYPRANHESKDSIPPRGTLPGRCLHGQYLNGKNVWSMTSADISCWSANSGWCKSMLKEWHELKSLMMHQVTRLRFVWKKKLKKKFCPLTNTVDGKWII